MMSESKDFKDYIEYLATKSSKEKKIGIVNDIIYLMTDKDITIKDWSVMTCIKSYFLNRNTMDCISDKKISRDFKMGLYSLTKANLSILRILIWIKIKSIKNNK